MSAATRDFKHTLISRIISIGLAVGVQSCLAWQLGMAGRGEYAVCQVFASLLSVFFAFGCDTAGVYFVSSKRFSISEGIVYSAICVAICSVTAIVCGLLVKTLPIAFFSKASQEAFTIALMTVPATLMAMIMLKLFTAVHMFRAFAVVSVLHVALHLGCVFIFVMGLSWGVKGALYSNLVREILTIVIALLVLRARLAISFVRPTYGRLAEMYHYGIRYYFGKVSNRVNSRLGTTILAFFATKEQIGLFDLASHLSIQVMTVPDSLSTVLLPRMCRDEVDRSAMIAKGARMTAFVCGIMLLVLCLFARPIIVVLFSTEFIGAVPLVRILSLGILLRSTCKVFVPYLLGINRPGIVSASVLVGVIVNVLLLVTLLPRIGLNAAALARSCGYAVSSLLLLRGFLKHSGSHVTAVFKYQPSDFKLLYPLRGVARG